VHARDSANGPTIVSGTVPSAEQRAKLIELAGRLFPDTRPEINVDIVPPPLCRSLADLDAMLASGLVAEGALSIRLNSGVPLLHEGDPMRIEVRSPPYPVTLRIDYFSLGGEVLHLWPTGNEPAPRLGPAVARVFGDPSEGKVVKAGGAPFGTELITIIATPLPIQLGARPAVERAADYLRDLKQVLGRGNHSAETPNLMAELMVKTSP
jgi:hypothetical protein